MLNITLTKINCSQEQFVKNGQYYKATEYFQKVNDTIKKYQTLSQNENIPESLKIVLLNIIDRMTAKKNILQNIPATEKAAESYIRTNVSAFYDLSCDMDSLHYFVDSIKNTIKTIEDQANLTINLITQKVCKMNLNPIYELTYSIKQEMTQTDFEKYMQNELLEQSKKENDKDFEYACKMPGASISTILAYLISGKLYISNISFLNCGNAFFSIKQNLQNYPEHRRLEEKLNILANKLYSDLDQANQELKNLIQNKTDQEVKNLINRKKDIESNIQQLLNNSYAHCTNRQKLFKLRDKNIKKYKKQLVELLKIQACQKKYEKRLLNYNNFMQHKKLTLTEAEKLINSVEQELEKNQN